MSIILYLFYAVLIVSTGRILIRLFLSIGYNLTRNKKETKVFPKISIIVPAFNEAKTIKNTEIAEELALPPVKIHCSVLAEDAINAAISDYRKKNN